MMIGAIRRPEMGVFGRLFGSRQQRQDAEKARQIIKAAFLKSREPRGCAASAASGADTRSRLFAVVDRLEAEMGQLVIAYAEKDGVLMTHPRLSQELSKFPDGEVLERAIFLCFITPTAVAQLNEDWPSRVASYQSRTNSDELISEKATLLTAYVVHNLGVGADVSREVMRDTLEINDEQELTVKLEEACLWYRLIDELAHLNIPQQRFRFMNFFEDNLAHLLALIGVEAKTICPILSTRSEEYGPFQEWVSGDTDKMAGTLFWNAAKHVGAPIGFERNFLFTQMFGTLFLERVNRAAVRELLIGKK
jgi:hypothetical protein